jgi:hypothetical protein
MSIGQEWLYERRERSLEDGAWRIEWAIQRLRITGETPRKWLAQTVDQEGGLWGDYSFPKKGGPTREARNARSLTTIAIHETEASLMDARAVRLEQEWVEKHRCGISDVVRLCDDASVLRQVATLVGFKEPA